MATLYEAEEAFEASDLERAHELAASARATSFPMRPPSAWRAPAAPSVRYGARCGLPRSTSAHHSIAPSRRCVVRRDRRGPSACSRSACAFALASGDSLLATSLAARAAWLGEARASAAAPNLVALRGEFPALAIARATARGRDLVARTRLSLAPVGRFEASVVVVVLDAAPHDALDAMPADDDTFVAYEGARQRVVATSDTSAADAFAERIARVAHVRAIGRAHGTVWAIADPSGELSLAGPAVERARSDATKTPANASSTAPPDPS